MTVKELIQMMDLRQFALAEPGRRVAGGYVGDLLSWVMSRAQEGDVWVTIMSNQNVAAVALMTEVSCVILAEGVEPDEELAARAQQQGINLLGTKLSAFDTAAALKQLLS